MGHTGASSIACVNYLYMPKCMCLVVFCLITQVKQYVSVGGKNAIRGLKIDRDKMPPESTNIHYKSNEGAINQEICTYLLPATLEDLFFWGGLKGGKQLLKLSFWQRKCSSITYLSDSHLEHTSMYKGRRKLTQKRLFYTDFSFWSFIRLYIKMNKQRVYCEESGEGERLSCWSAVCHEILGGICSQRCCSGADPVTYTRRGLQLGHLPKRFYQ